MSSPRSALNSLQSAANAAPYTTTITVGGVATPIKLFSADDLNDAINNGVQHFINRIKAKLNKADDLVNLAFVTAQTDIYRYRQNVLGASDASRLATSPILANIAMGDSASATAQNIGTYFDSISGTTPVPKTAGAQAATAEPIRPPVVTRSFTNMRSVAPMANNRVLINRLAATPFRPGVPFGPVHVAPPRPVSPAPKPGTATVSGVGAVRAGAPVAPRVLFDTSQLRLTTSIPKSDLSASHVASTSDVDSQQPVVGAQLDLRTLTVGGTPCSVEVAGGPLL